MKHKIIYIFILTFLVIQVNAQKFYNMTKVGENMWVDNTEITVNQYRQFLNSLPTNEKGKYLPDSTLIAEYDESLTNYYFNHPAYENYPMICINYDQVLAFCKWRTELYNTEPNNQLKVEYTLPSQSEWDSIASIGKLGGAYAGTLTHPLEPIHSKEKKFLKKNKFLVLCKEMNPNFATNSLYCFGEGKIKGLAGNVAEMTLDKKVVGGSWLHPAEYSKIGHVMEDDPYKSSVYIGFRCIVKIIK